MLAWGRARARGMAEIAAVLAHWQLDMRHVRERTYRAPTPREPERCNALWLLTQGWPTSKVAELLERDAHTIGAWLATLDRDGPAALAFEQMGGAPCPRGGRLGGAEGGGPGYPGRGRHRAGRLELESRAAVHRGALRGPAQPRHLLALPAPPGLRPQATEEAAAQGRRGQARGARRAVCRVAAGGPGAGGRRSSSWTRPTSAPTRTCGASGC